MTIFEAHHLSPWEEGALRLSNLTEANGCLVASGGKVRLCLPLHMKVELAKYVGLRISILRTDIGYRIRLLDEKR
jgi:hypothetical protein